MANASYVTWSRWGESHPTWLQVSFSGWGIKGDGFLVLCCASIYSTLHLYPHLNEGAVKHDVCLFHTQMSGKEALMQIQDA